MTSGASASGPDGRTPEKDRTTEEHILDEAQGSPTLPDGSPRPKDGPDSARGMQTDAKEDLTKPGRQAEDR